MKKLGFGCMRFPLLNPEDGKSIDFDQVCQMVDTFLEKGFTYFDTAYMYHEYQSEHAVKKVLVDRHPRESFTLASKLPVSFLKSKEDRERIFNEQLAKCGVDYFDYYLLHNIQDVYYESNVQAFDCFGFAMQKKAEGKIKCLGFSFHDTAEVLDKVLTDHPEAEFVQLQINYLDWENERIQSRKCYEVAVKHGKKVVIMEPVKGGMLAQLPEEAEALLKNANQDLSIPSWAIRYAASLPEVMVVLSGMSSMEQMLDNTSYMQEFQPLTEKEMALTAEAAEIIRNAVKVPCTSCRYCVEGCPKGIEIPELFTIFNAEYQALNRGYSTQKENYAAKTAESGKASDCIACKKCEKICPQHIRISEMMKEVAKMLEA